MESESSASILLIEDDRVSRVTISSFLLDAGFRMIEAVDGPAGLDAFRREHPDLVLVDLRLPGLDGLQVLLRLRQEAPDIPVIVISGTGIISDVVEALRLGAAGFIQKPIQDMMVLQHEIEKALERLTLVRRNYEYQNHLEQLVASRTSQLQSANTALHKEIQERERAERHRTTLIAKLESQNAELEQFAYTVSHDLRAPLVTIKGYAGLLARVMDDPTSTEDCVTRISDAADKMDRLLSDTLELSRIGRVVHPASHVRLSDLTEEVAGLLAQELESHHVQLDAAPDGPVLWGDPIRLREVLQNLVENAIKYMGDQTQPCIHVFGSENAVETVCGVRDNGMGIAPEHHDRIFRIFSQLDPHSDGSGIGLTLAKRIVEVHGGRLWVESDGVGHGATFRFTLPKANGAVES